MTLSDFYHQILRLNNSWQIKDISVDANEKRIDLYLSHSANTKFPCAFCEKSCSVYDHNKSRTWRHLDTCDHTTYLHASLPRVKCEDCGVHTIKAIWSSGSSRFTLQFESQIIDVLEQTQVLSHSALLLNLSVDQVRYVRDKSVNRGLVKRTEHTCYQVASTFVYR